MNSRHGGREGGVDGYGIGGKGPWLGGALVTALVAVQDRGVRERVGGVGAAELVDQQLVAVVVCQLNVAGPVAGHGLPLGLVDADRGALRYRQDLAAGGHAGSVSVAVVHKNFGPPIRRVPTRGQVQSRCGNRPQPARGCASGGVE